MRKVLLILLLFALPFQYSWAAAAAYCQHGTTHATHFGHHSHQHVAQAGEAADKSEEKAKMAALDDDCGYCHLSCQLTPTPADPAVSAGPALIPTVLPPTAFSSHFPEGPKRPDRSLAA